MIPAVIIVLILATLTVGWRAWHRLRHVLHMAQLHGYKPREYSEWLFSRGRRLIVRPSHVAALVVLVLAYPATQFYLTSTSAFLGVAWIVLFASAADYLKPDTKKPVKFTARLNRLATGVVLVMIVPALVFMPLGNLGDRDVFHILATLALMDWAAPLAVLVGTIVMLPIEITIQNGFKRRARKKLASMPQLKIIAITGSYGKTSVKFVVAEILRQKYNVLATPGSYNTPMGICLVINRDLKPEHQILVLEMGARYAGDIQELCNIARPHTGIVTNVGIAHLETMGSRENIATEKGTLVENILPGGFAVLNGDDELVRSMQSRTEQPVYFAGIDSPDALLTAKNLEYNTRGASFDLADHEGESTTVNTRLIGRHNIMNIVMGAAVGLKYGLRMRQIAHAIDRLQPVEHRLQVKESGGVIIIDDAFNSNPVGARNAVDILGQFPGGRRIIVTPGMIELGDRQYEENRLLGEAIAGNADMVLLVGRDQTRPIMDGLTARNYPEAQVKIFNSLREVQNFLSAELTSGDVVLYENDLPDQFDEAV